MPMHSMTAGAFNLGGCVDAPSRFENGTVNNQKHSYAQDSTNDEQLCHATDLSTPPLDAPSMPRSAAVSSENNPTPTGSVGADRAICVRRRPRCVA